MVGIPSTIWKFQKKKYGTSNNIYYLHLQTFANIRKHSQTFANIFSRIIYCEPHNIRKNAKSERRRRRNYLKEEEI